ncbi:MAG: hypothetical protein L6R41_002870 [Letrouitia leprolyta]|nr:MAG: hypothetical protein L6R41_002870 [Letrouitia leprolyta]
MSHSPSRPHAAYIEDYNEDAHTTVPESRQTANVAAKRSKPEISAVKLTESGRDEASDSGYSSHTAATLGSRDSSSGSKVGSATLTLDTNMESLVARKRRPTITQRSSQTTPQSPQKPSLRRSDSKARQKEALRQGSCKCGDCQAKAKSKTQRPTVSPQNTSSSSPEQAKQKPAANTDNPPAPKNVQISVPPVTAAAPVIQPAQPRPRHSGSQSYRSTPRPVSFHGGIMPQPMYYQPVIIARPPSAFPTQSPFPPPSYPPPTTSYFPSPYQNPHPQPPTTSQPSPTMHRELYTIPPSPYNLPSQTQPHPWSTGQHAPPRQPITYSAPPIVEYPHASQFTASNQPTMHRTFSERDQERPIPLRDEYFTFDRAFDDDYYRMPPPPAPPLKPPNTSHHRPSIRHAATTTSRTPHTGQYFTQERSEEDQTQRSPHRYAGEYHDKPSRPALAVRHSNVKGSERTHGMDRLEQNFASMSVEGSSAAAKQRRRMTYYGGPIPKDLERQVEAYQAEKQASAETETTPLTADSLKLVRRKTQTSNSDAGSRVSAEGRASREGSDVKPRSATGRRGSSDVKARNDDGFTMRFNTSQGVNVDLKGGAKDRTISLRQSREGEGNMELSIKGKNDTRDKSRRRQSYIDGSTVRELESLRAGSRMGRPSREADGERHKERSVAGSQSRRSSKSRRTFLGL